MRQINPKVLFCLWKKMQTRLKSSTLFGKVRKYAENDRNLKRSVHPRSRGGEQHNQLHALAFTCKWFGKKSEVIYLNVVSHSVGYAVTGGSATKSPLANRRHMAENVNLEAF